MVYNAALLEVTLNLDISLQRQYIYMHLKSSVSVWIYVIYILNFYEQQTILKPVKSV